MMNKENLKKLGPARGESGTYMHLKWFLTMAYLFNHTHTKTHKSVVNTTYFHKKNQIKYYAISYLYQYLVFLNGSFYD
jgi:hypothetical protein